jgi:hypothetical protein
VQVLRADAKRKWGLEVHSLGQITCRLSVGIDLTDFDPAISRQYLNAQALEQLDRSDGALHQQGNRRGPSQTVGPIQR